VGIREEDFCGGGPKIRATERVPSAGISGSREKGAERARKISTVKGVSVAGGEKGRSQIS